MSLQLSLKNQVGFKRKWNVAAPINFEDKRIVLG